MEEEDGGEREGVEARKREWRRRMNMEKKEEEENEKKNEKEEQSENEEEEKKEQSENEEEEEEEEGRRGRETETQGEEREAGKATRRTRGAWPSVSIKSFTKRQTRKMRRRNRSVSRTTLIGFPKRPSLSRKEYRFLCQARDETKGKNL